MNVHNESSSKSAQRIVFQLYLIVQIPKIG